MTIHHAFPRLVTEGYTVTSDRTPDYNCIAWAAGESERWWWPDSFEEYYWPPNIRRHESLEAFVEAFASLGYVICDDDRLEAGFEKIAIYVDSLGLPTHASRQLRHGKWTSKLGEDVDIEHTIVGLVSDQYGSVGAFMKRAHSSA